MRCTNSKYTCIKILRRNFIPKLRLLGLKQKIDRMKTHVVIVFIYKRLRNIFLE